MSSENIKGQTGEDVARRYKYYRQFFNSYITSPVHLNRISASQLYKRHKHQFDKLAYLFLKNNVSIDSYIKFFADDLGKCEKDIDSCLLSKESLQAYSVHVATIAKRRKIFKWFHKSAKNLADLCIALHLPASEGFRYLVQHKMLAGWYVGGKISKYFLVAIPKFNNVIDKLDHFSKLEFNDIRDKYDIYNTEVNESLLYCKSIKINPITYTDKIISQLSCQ